MGRSRFDWQQSARHLVLALSAAFEHLNAARDAVFDDLVVTGFEMKHRMMLESAPIAPVKRRGVTHVEGGGNRPAFAIGEHENEIVRHRLSETLEEFQVEIRRRMVLAVRARVAAEEK